MKKYRSVTAWLLCFILVLCCGSTDVKASGESKEYYIAVSFAYYNEQSQDYDLHFYKMPEKNFLFQCGSWTHEVSFSREPFGITYKDVHYDEVYDFPHYLHDLSMTDFSKGEPMHLISYPVPEGYTALTPDVITVTKEYVDRWQTTQLHFRIVVKKAEDHISFNNTGLVISVEKGVEGSISWPYTGKAVCPKVLSVTTPWGKELRENVDYVVSYRNNIEPGDGIIIIQGIGEYSGEKEYTNQFNIYKTPSKADESTESSSSDKSKTDNTTKPGNGSISTESKTKIESIKGYLISSSKTALYKKSDLKQRKAWINADTELTITSVKTKYVKVSYTQDGKKKTGYVKTKELFGGTTYDRKFASKKINAYRKYKGGKTYGTIGAGDEVFILGKKGSYTHVMYRYKKVLRLGWIKTKDAEKKLVSMAKAETASLKMDALGSPSQLKALTSTVGSAHISNIKTLSGVYTVNSSQSTAYLLDIHGNALNNEGNLEICRKNNGDNQKFRFIYQDNGFYAIQCCESDLFLDVNMQTGNVTQYEWNGGDNQLWGITRMSKSKIFIWSKWNGWYLDNNRSKLNNGNNVSVRPFEGGSNQIWQMKGSSEPGTRNIAEGLYKLVSAQNPKYVMDVYFENGYPFHRNDNVQLCQDNGGPNQIFYIRYQKNGYYRLFVDNSSFAVKVYAPDIDKHISSSTLHIDSTLYPEDGWFKFIPAGDGSYYIRSKFNGCYIDNANGRLSDGNDILTYQFNGADNQKWRLLRIY